MIGTKVRVGTYKYRLNQQTLSKILKLKIRWIGWFVTPVSILVIRYVCNFMGISLGFPFPGTLFVVWYTYYYLGMGIGNGIFKWKVSRSGTLIMYMGTLILSECEGFCWYQYGNYDMATTQIRLTSLLTSTLACLLSYQYIEDDNITLRNNVFTKIMITIGNCSFGIYLVHILVMKVLDKILVINTILFPINSLAIIICSTCFVIICKKYLPPKVKHYIGIS